MGFFDIKIDFSPLITELSRIPAATDENNFLNDALKDILVIINSSVEGLNLSQVLTDNFHSLTPTEKKNVKAIHNALIKFINGDNLVKFLKGAHFVIEDNGELFQHFNTTGLVAARHSSHYPTAADKIEGGIRAGNLFKEILIGKTTDKDNKTITFIQLESHIVDLKLTFNLIKILHSIKELILHMCDYIVYKATGKNVGQYGLSEHTEHHKPIRIKQHSPRAQDIIAPQNNTTPDTTSKLNKISKQDTREKQQEKHKSKKGKQGTNTKARYTTNTKHTTKVKLQPKIQDNGR
ncbi:hypothetical protein EF513_00295 [Rickettsiales endosymbiont of Stachyamoeba lipophora]|nr:hypothetical protein EF513_00295 [Rickettsiales endosymbiont of Stachyamoeba lipophora]